MRDYALFLLIFGSLPLILRRPWYGILVWSFLSYANPHRQCWGPAFSFPFAQVVALTLFAALLVNPQKMTVPKSALLGAWAVFMIWIAITTTVAIYPDGALQQLEKV